MSKPKPPSATPPASLAVLAAPAPPALPPPALPPLADTPPALPPPADPPSTDAAAQQVEAIAAPAQPDESPEVEVAITRAGIRCLGCGRDCVPRIRRTRPARMQREGTCPFCGAHLRMTYRTDGTVENVTRI